MRTATKSTVKSQEPTVKERENSTVLSNEAIIAILTKAFAELQNHELRITSLEQLKEASDCSITNAANQLFPAKPENDIDIVMSYNIVEFRDWMKAANDYHLNKTGKELRSAYVKIYGMLDHSGVSCINKAMQGVRTSYDPSHAPQKTLYKLIYNDNMLKGVFLAALIEELEIL